MSTLAQLTTRVRGKIDEATAAFWTDAIINAQINESYNHYWGLIIKAFESYFATKSNIDFDGNSSGVYDLPSDCFKVRLVSRIMSNEKIPLRYYERYDNAVPTTISQSIYNMPTYRFRGSQIIFEPAPDFSLSDAIELEYIRKLNPLSASVDVDSQFAAIPPAEDCVVLRATIKCKQIEEMVAGGGADNTPFINDLLTSEQMLKEIIEQRSTSRIYVEQWGESDNDSVQTWTL